MVMGLVVPMYLPLVVLRLEGAEHAAYFGLSQVLATGATLFVLAVHTSYVAEASHPDTDTAACTRRLAQMTTTVAVFGAAVLALIGPVVLALVGGAYRSHAATHLVLFALSILPQALIGAYAVMSRVRNRMRILLTVQVLSVTGMVTLTPFAITRWGISGVGATYLLVETVCAVVLLGPLVRAWRDLTRPERAR
ncbi:hypothetical protein [Nocardioides alcanivorans]|uniref:hypothetical protein n=1 Tax=Nocardioides alcanivorans TaxID=2897352 RepID=UPI001F28A2AA|nr:hypothetical protein [Nocardioides alcanivorans]